MRAWLRFPKMGRNAPPPWQILLMRRGRHGGEVLATHPIFAFYDAQNSRHISIDKRLCIGYEVISRPPKGRVLEAHLNTGRVRYLRADLHSALGRPWEDARPALRPVYEKLVRLGQAETDNVRFLAKSQEARPGAERWRSFAYARAAAERR
jgi:hypothetical protein